MNKLSELSRIPKIDKQTSLIFKALVSEYGEGKQFSKKDLLYLLNDENLLEGINISYDISTDIEDPIYTFDIDRKKRGRPSKNNSNKIVLSENINVDNINWENIYVNKNKNIIKYWRFHIKKNNSIILNQGLVLNNRYDKGIVVDKNFEDKASLNDFINKNISEKKKKGYIQKI